VSLLSGGAVPGGAAKCRNAKSVLYSKRIVPRPRPARQPLPHESLIMNFMIQPWSGGRAADSIGVMVFV